MKEEKKYIAISEPASVDEHSPEASLSHVMSTLARLITPKLKGQFQSQGTLTALDGLPNGFWFASTSRA
jgi:hypothetical protein